MMNTINFIKLTSKNAVKKDAFSLPAFKYFLYGCNEGEPTFEKNVVTLNSPFICSTEMKRVVERRYKFLIQGFLWLISFPDHTRMFWDRAITKNPRGE